MLGDQALRAAGAQSVVGTGWYMRFGRQQCDGIVRSRQRLATYGSQTRDVQLPDEDDGKETRRP